MPGSVSAECALTWTTNGAEKKITVANAATAPRYPIRVAVSKMLSDNAEPVGEVLFQDVGSRDFVRGISRSAGECRLQLTAAVGPKNVGDAEIHFLTYTITSH